MYNLKDITNRILVGDVREVLKQIPDNSVDLVMTSPPYFQLRDYGTQPVIWGGDPSCQHDWGEDEVKHLRGNAYTANVGNNKNDYGGRLKEINLGSFCQKCGAWCGELGREPDPNLFVSHLLEVFKEVKRVLKDGGSCYVNLGDSYNGSGGDHKAHHQTNSGFQGKGGELRGGQARSLSIMPRQSLMGVPYRFALRMADDLGFVWRSHINWFKRNCMPASVQNRFTIDFEPIFFFTKKPTGYFFEQQFEPSKNFQDDVRRIMKNKEYSKDRQGGNANFAQVSERDSDAVQARMTMGRNMRTTWDVPTQPNRLDHYAGFPPKLVERVIAAGCPQYICNRCGKPRMKVYEVVGKEKCPPIGGNKKAGGDNHTYSGNAEKSIKRESGYSDCGCNAGFHPGLVLDPFMGSGTTAVVARKMCRYYLGIDIKDEYADMARKRVFREFELDYNF